MRGCHAKQGTNHTGENFVCRQGRVFGKGLSESLSSHHCEGGWRYHRGTVWLLRGSLTPFRMKNSV